MKWLLGFTLCFVLFAASCGQARVDHMLEGYMWEKRLFLVFAPKEEDERLITQLKEIEMHQDGFEERQLLNWILVAQTHVSVGGEYQPQLGTDPFYKEFDVGIRDFKTVLIGKDGEVKKQSNQIMKAEELFTIIDAMPMRQQEILENDN